MISLVCPSRGRPAAFAAMVASALGRAADPDCVQVVAYLDDDDPELAEYRTEDVAGRMTLLTGERCTLSDAWDRAAAEAKGDVLMLAADDLRFRTPGWDTIVFGCMAGLFPDGLGVVYGRDGHADKRMATHPFVSRRWVETVGRFTPPYFCADYVDLWLHDVASRAGRLAFLPGLLVEHLHPSYGKGAWDRTHEERLARAKDADLPALWGSLEAERAAEAEKVKAAIG